MIAVSTGIQNPCSVCNGFSDKAIQAPGRIAFVVFVMNFMVTDPKQAKNQIFCEFTLIHFFSLKILPSKR